MTFGLGVGGLAVLALSAVIVMLVFGRKALRGVLKVGAIIFLIWIAYLWRSEWVPIVQPVLNEVKAAFGAATAGPQ